LITSVEIAATAVSRIECMPGAKKMPKFVRENADAVS
jgi:hypothetical protein